MGIQIPLTISPYNLPNLFPNRACGKLENLVPACFRGHQAGTPSALTVLPVSPATPSQRMEPSYRTAFQRALAGPRNDEPSPSREIPRPTPPQGPTGKYGRFRHIVRFARIPQTIRIAYVTLTASELTLQISPPRLSSHLPPPKALQLAFMGREIRSNILRTHATA